MHVQFRMFAAGKPRPRVPGQWFLAGVQGSLRRQQPSTATGDFNCTMSSIITSLVLSIGGQGTVCKHGLDQCLLRDSFHDISEAHSTERAASELAAV